MTRRTLELIGVDKAGNESKFLVPNVATYEQAFTVGLATNPRFDEVMTVTRHRRRRRDGAPRPPVFGNLAMAEAFDQARHERIGARARRGSQTPGQPAPPTPTPRISALSAREELENLFRPKDQPEEDPTPISRTELANVIQASVLPQLGSGPITGAEIKGKIPAKYANRSPEKAFHNAIAYLIENGVLTRVGERSGVYSVNPEVHHAPASKPEVRADVPRTNGQHQATLPAEQPVASMTHAAAICLTMDEKATALISFASSLLTADDDYSRRLSEISDKVMSALSDRQAFEDEFKRRLAETSDRVLTALTELQGLIVEARRLPELSINVARRLQGDTTQQAAA